MRVSTKMLIHSQRTTVLEARSPKTAVLMTPNETQIFRMQAKSRLLEYVENNITEWYRFSKQTLGRDVENGDLRVVYACRKASGFGIAAAYNTYGQENTRLTFSVDRAWADISGCPYHWSHTGTAVVKAGPSQQDYSDISLSNQSPRNQCLFISTIDTKVSAETWSEIEKIGIPTRHADSRPSSSITPSRDRATQQGVTSTSETQNSTTLSSSHQFQQVFCSPLSSIRMRLMVVYSARCTPRQSCIICCRQLYAPTSRLAFFVR